MITEASDAVNWYASCDGFRVCLTRRLRHSSAPFPHQQLQADRRRSTELLRNARGSVKFGKPSKTTSGRVCWRRVLARGDCKNPLILLPYTRAITSGSPALEATCYSASMAQTTTAQATPLRYGQQMGLRQ